MIFHEVEGGCKDTSDVRRVSGICYASDVSISFYDVGVRRGIIRSDGWLEITVVLHHVDSGETSVGGVHVPFDAELIRGVAEVPCIFV